MITISLLFTTKESAENVLKEMIADQLIYGGFIQSIEGWKRESKLPKYNFQFLLTGLTRAVAFSRIITSIDKKFPSTEYLAYSNPMLNLSGNHEELLKKNVL